jgi:heat shock protein HslJ
MLPVRPLSRIDLDPGGPQLTVDEKEANKVPHSFARPLLSAVALLIGASILAATVSAATVATRGELTGQLAVGGSAPEQEVADASDFAPIIGGLPSELTDGSWRLDTYSSDGFPTPVLPDTLITATFETDGTVNGNASCNDYSGPYRVIEIAISIGPLFTTRMACDRDVMDQEQAYLDAMESAETYSVQASTLTLAAAGGLPVAVFGRSLLSTAPPSPEDS